MARVMVVDYRMGNLRSVANALEFLGATAVISSDPAALATADAVVLPGVGAFQDGMANLGNLGLIEPLRRTVLDEGRPFLGLCLGLQLLAQDSTEGGLGEGLGWLPARVRRLDVSAQGLRLPHVGWNDVQVVSENPLFSGLGEVTSFYFVHSYHLVCDDPGLVSGRCDYGQPFIAAVQKDNIYATQFHPEKSQRSGLTLLRNFLDVVGR